jgi:hypothetical protein
MTSLHDLDPQFILSAFTEFKERYAITNPRPVEPDHERPAQVQLRHNWRAWAFGPVAIASALVAAIRTAAAANRISSVSTVFSFIPSQAESMLAVVAVDVTIVIGMLVLAYSRLQNLKTHELRKEMENLKFLKLAVGIALAISLTANITQVFREQFDTLWPQVDVAFDVALALSFSVGLNILALVGAEQVAYLLAWTRLENLDAVRVWKRDRDRLLDEWKTAVETWEVKVVRSWNSQKSKILKLSTVPVQRRPKVSRSQTDGLPTGVWSKPRKKGHVYTLIHGLCENGHMAVGYNQIKAQLGTISRASLYLYANELVAEGRLVKGKDGQGWSIPIEEGF